MVILSGNFLVPTKDAPSVPSTFQVYVPTAGFPRVPGWLGAGEGAVDFGAVVGTGPDAARVVGVVARGPDVAPEVAALAAVVAVVLEDAGAVADGSAAEVVGVPPVVPVVASVDDVELGAPATANWPPRRNDGGPLWVSL